MNDIILTISGFQKSILFVININRFSKYSRATAQTISGFNVKNVSRRVAKCPVYLRAPIHLLFVGFDIRVTTRYARMCTRKSSLAMCVDARVDIRDQR